MFFARDEILTREFETHTTDTEWKKMARLKYHTTAVDNQFKKWIASNGKLEF